MVLETIVILSGRLVTIQKKIDNVNVLESSLKRSSQICTLVELDKSVFKFVCFVGKMRRFFMFELTPFSTSVFKNFQVRKTDKALLKHHLTTNVLESQPPTDTMFVRWRCSPPLSEDIQ